MSFPPRRFPKPRFSMENSIRDLKIYNAALDAFLLHLSVLITDREKGKTDLSDRDWLSEMIKLRIRGLK